MYLVTVEGQPSRSRTYHNVRDAVRYASDMVKRFGRHVVDIVTLES